MLIHTLICSPGGGGGGRATANHLSQKLGAGDAVAGLAGVFTQLPLFKAVSNASVLMVQHKQNTKRSSQSTNLHNPFALCTKLILVGSTAYIMLNMGCAREKKQDHK